MAVNLKHAFFAIQAVAPAMIAAGRGSIINFGSISWMIMSPRLPVYETAKAAAHGLSRGMARELGPHGIRVNTLVPGWVMTERQLALWVDEAGIKAMETNQALKGRVMPIDIARMALFLASDDSAMVTGQDFIVDAGWTHG
jgi:NAD(P)-dependent dehydrogenase (short-subunit alcohol dehydrogenase family)